MTVSRRSALKSGLALGATRDDPRDHVGERLHSIGISQTRRPRRHRSRSSRSRTTSAPRANAWTRLRGSTSRAVPRTRSRCAGTVDAYRSMRLLPRQLRDVSSLDLSVTLLGIGSPTRSSSRRLPATNSAHADGEVGTARGARAAAAAMVLSSYSTVPGRTGRGREAAGVSGFSCTCRTGRIPKRLVRRARLLAGASANRRDRGHSGRWAAAIARYGRGSCFRRTCRTSPARRPSIR
jgi:hypothetical protein